MAAAWLASGGRLPFGVKPPTPTINRAHPLAQGLVFDANYFAPGLGGNIERVGLTPRSTYTGTATAIGPHGVARTFAGAASTDRDTYATNPAVNDLGILSLEILIKLNGATTGGNGRIVAKGVGESRFAVEYDSGLGFLQFSAVRTTDGSWTTPNASIAQGVWNHVVITYDWNSTANDPVFCINGVPQTITEVSTPSGTPGTDTANIYVGNRDDGTRCANANISHLRLWNRMLSPGEAVQLYADPFQIYAPPKRRALSRVPAGTQTLTPSLFTNTSTFYAPTVTPGSVTLTPSLFTNSNTFYSPTVSQAGTQTLTPSLFTNSSTFYSPTVTPGSVTLTPSLFTNSSTFYSPTVTRGTVTLTPALFTNTSAFYAPTVTPGAVTISPALFTNASVFYAPTVYEPGGVQTLLPSLFTNVSVFYAPEVANDDAPGTYPLAIEGDPSTVRGALTGGGSVTAGSIPTTGRVIAGYLRGRP